MMCVNRYRDRREAGQALARHLAAFDCRREDTLLLGLPRGGVLVAAEIGRQLELSVDAFLVRRLRLPDEPATAIGAIASGGVQLLDEALIAERQLAPAAVARIVTREAAELEQQEVLFRGDRPPPDITGRHVVLVDDGVATGHTMRVAILALQQLQPSRLTVALPAGTPETCLTLAAAVDHLVCPLQPDPLVAVGLWYDHFPAVSDHDVADALAHIASVAP